jgi:hypothetical protein
MELINGDEIQSVVEKKGAFSGNHQFSNVINSIYRM